MAAVARRILSWGFALAWLLPLCASLLPASSAHASCDVIPGVTQEFRGALGSVNRPFAIPGDEGQQISIALRPDDCSASSGFVSLGGGSVEDDYFVTVLFEPPDGGAVNAVVLTSDGAANQAACTALLPAAGSLANGGSATCRNPAAGVPQVWIDSACVGGDDDGDACTSGCREARAITPT